ncbi:MAG: uroporphyrinogen decarboxylase family protein [Candidatus Avilachnospira sp.]|jgi:uroporphyrinogen decarboxylase
MNRRENTLAAVRGQEPDYIPSGFWLHFPKECFHGDAAVEAHLKFFEESETDIMKIMNENVIPCSVPINKPEDWANIPEFDKNSKFIQDQLEITKKIIDKVHDNGIVLLTVHGIVASAWHARGGTDGYETGSSFLTEHLRANPKAVAQAYDRISDALVTLTEEALKIGVDGIYYAALGGESYLYTDEEFEEFVKPYDLKILNAAAKRPAFNILHVCKDRLNLNRYKDYPTDVVNWGVYEQNPSLEEGRELFGDAAILGGLDDRAGVLVDGTEEEIRAEVHSVIKRMGRHKFLLGADCTLPTDIDTERIRTAVRAAKD